MSNSSLVSTLRLYWLIQIPFLRENDYLDEVLEKQADMIRYLQQHNANLGKRLMKLTAQQSRSNLNTM